MHCHLMHVTQFFCEQQTPTQQMSHDECMIVGEEEAVGWWGEEKGGGFRCVGAEGVRGCTVRNPNRM